MTRLIAIAALVVLAGCATVKPYGTDSYRYNGRRQVDNARRFCAARGLRMEPLAEVQPAYADEFVFRCVK